MSKKRAWPATAYIVGIFGSLALAVLMLVAINPAKPASANFGCEKEGVWTDWTSWLDFLNHCPDPVDNHDPPPNDTDNNHDGDWWKKNCKFDWKDCFGHQDKCDEIDDWRHWDDDDHDIDFVRDHDGCLRVIIINKVTIVAATPVATPQTTIIVQTQPVVPAPAPPPQIIVIREPAAPAAPPPPQQVAAATGLVAPPRTGEAGLADRDSSGVSVFAAAAIALALAGLGTAGFAYKRRVARD